MQESLEALKQYSIISPDEVKQLRHSILQNHPYLSEDQRAQLFAKCLHQKLDDALSFFDVSIQKNIKNDLLKEAVTKPLFSINVLDILQTYTQVESITSTNVKSLTSWVNQYKTKPLSEEMLFTLTQDLMKSSYEISSDNFVNDVPAKPSTMSLSQWSFNLPRLNVSLDKPWLILGLISTFLLLAFFIRGTHQLSIGKQTLSNWANTPVSLPISLDLADSSNYLCESLQYKKINQTALHDWLSEKQSILATEPYFSSIINTAYAFDINPLLIFAITGQEQNFVPSTHEAATYIANNPFNLYGSWQEYNTSIEDATCIVARTIIRLGKDCPDGYDQIKWINRKYAADPNWHLGVSYFLQELEQAAG